MNEICTFLTLVALLAGSSLQAQTTGNTAVTTAKTAKENHWQNWTFAASAMATAAGAIFVVSMDNGNHAH